MKRDEKLDKAMSRFVSMFEFVFGSTDWEYTKLCLKEPDSFVDPQGTFINPLVEDEGNNWSARSALLEAYRDVVEAMNTARVYQIDQEQPPVLEDDGDHGGNPTF